MIIGQIKRPSTEIVEGFRKTSVTTLSDVFDRLGLSGIVVGLKQVVQHQPIVGTAVTVKVITGLKGEYLRSDFNLGAVFSAVEKGDVLVFDNSGMPVSTLGDMACLYLKQIGGEGAIIDGACRDVDEIRKVGLPVYTRHFVPISGVTRLKFTSINSPVQCGGVTVNPGDVIVGDSTGIAIVPSERSSEILQIALSIEQREIKIREEILNGTDFMEALAKFSLL